MTAFRPSSSLFLAFNKSIQLELSAKIASLSALPLHSLTPEMQAALIHCTSGFPTNLQVEAVAGSGKTYLLLRIIQALSLTPEVKTLNSLGWHAWRSKTGKRPNTFGGKLSLIAKLSGLHRQQVESSTHSLGWYATRLAAKAKIFGLTPGDIGSPLVEDTDTQWREIATQFDLRDDGDIIRAARQLLEVSITWARQGRAPNPRQRSRGRQPSLELTLDFDDQLYMPVCFKAPFARRDLIILDEDQDLNLIQHEIVARLLGPRSRLLGAGDPFQAIYQFRGAAADSIPLLVSRFSMTTRPLTFSFRCAKAIIADAQQDVPHIQPLSSAPLGQSITHSSDQSLLDETSPGHFLAPPLSVQSLPETVLARTNAPIVQLALSCLAAGRPAYIRGREIGEGLISLISDASSGQESQPVSTFQSAFPPFIRSLIAKAPARRFTLVDKANAISALATSTLTLLGPAATVSDLCAILDRIYPKDQNLRPTDGVYLSTIHKAKGLEWDSVLFLEPDLCTHFENKALERDDPAAAQSERNIRYVGRTRARQVIHYSPAASIIGNGSQESDSQWLPDEDTPPNSHSVPDLDSLLQF